VSSVVVRRVLIVQHGEKERLPGDPGLTALGHAQATATADWLLAREAPEAIWSSPLRRAVETAEPIAERFGVDVVLDARLRERMNWEGPHVESIDEFLQDWQRASADRSYVPGSGDSSEQAAGRFLAALADIGYTTHTSGLVVVVAHGGVTVDVLRTLLGDESLLAAVPSLIDEGVPCGAITELRHDTNRWVVDSLPVSDHLAPSTGHRPA